MPELAEVETVKENLKPLIIGRKIIKAEVKWPNIIASSSANDFIDNIVNQTILDIKRHGKWLIIALDDFNWLIHLRMEGKFNYYDKENPLNKHEHVIFILDDGHELRYMDTRKFGKMYLKRKDELFTTLPLSKVGLDLFDEQLTAKYLVKHLKKKQIPIKTALINQDIIAGLGNIYVNEVLYSCKINPLKPACQINESDASHIISIGRTILTKAIECGGTTIRSFTSSANHPGSFQKYLLVHGKDHTPCLKCGTIIEKIWINKRGTYYCPACQK